MTMNSEILVRPRPPAAPEDRALSARLLAEFREMPGLRLTIAQAARLFGVNPSECERLLRRLVDAGVLRTDGGLFAVANARP